MSLDTLDEKKYQDITKGGCLKDVLEGIKEARRVGLINAISCKFYDNCNRVRLTADGKVKPCLHSNNEIDLRNSLRNGEDVKKIILN